MDNSSFKLELLELAALRDLMSQFKSAGLQVAATGAAAFGLLHEIPLPPGERVTLIGWGEGQAQVQTLIQDSKLAPAIDLRWRKASDEAEPLKAMTACTPEIDEAPVRPWTLVIEASGRIHDPRQALAGAHKGELQIQGEPRSWLEGSPARLLKLAAWAASTGLSPKGALLEIARAEAPKIQELDHDVWRKGFEMILGAWKTSAGLSFLQRAGALPLMLPELSAMEGFHKSCPVHHKDIWDHTLKVVDKCPRNLAVRWAALMHDAGKVGTRRIGAGGHVHFFGHEQRGARMMNAVADRFNFPNDLRERVIFIIGNHNRANVYNTQWTDSAVRRLVRDMGEHLDDVIAFSQSDYTTKRAWRIREVQTLASELRLRIRRVIEEDAWKPPLPKGFGTLVIEETGRRGGPWLGEVQRWLEDEVEDGALPGGLSAETYLEWVREHNPDLLTAPDPPRRPQQS